MRLKPSQLVGASLSVLVHAAVLSLAWNQTIVVATEPAPESVMQVSLITLAEPPAPVELAKPEPQPQPEPVARAAPAPRPRPSVPRLVEPASVPEPALEPDLPAAATTPAHEVPSSVTTANLDDAAQAEPSAPATPSVASAGPAPVDETLFIQQPQFRRPPQPPVYPRLSRTRGESGTVLLRARVREDGSVGEIEVSRSSGYRLLDRAAVSAARDWEIEPYRRNQVALAAWVELPVHFELRSREQLARHP